VDWVQGPLEADLADSLLEPDHRVASAEPAPVETLPLNLARARVAGKREAPDLRGCAAAKAILPLTPTVKSQLVTRQRQGIG
jgi:hypothetical protein